MILFAFIAFFILIIRIPIIIAKGRGITGSDMTTIAVLSWFGIFFGLTWVIALVLSLVWGGSLSIKIENAEQGGETLDKLEKLHRLKKSGAITKKEFEAQKKKLLD